VGYILHGGEGEKEGLGRPDAAQQTLQPTRPISHLLADRDGLAWRGLSPLLKWQTPESRQTRAPHWCAWLRHSCRPKVSHLGYSPLNRACPSPICCRRSSASLVVDDSVSHAQRPARDSAAKITAKGPAPKRRPRNCDPRCSGTGLL
jgi:hypothetical protein